MTQKGKMIFGALLVIALVFVAHHFLNKNSAKENVNVKTDSSVVAKDSLVKYQPLNKVETKETTTQKEVVKSVETGKKTIKQPVVKEKVKQIKKETTTPTKKKDGDRENLDIKF